MKLNSFPEKCSGCQACKLACAIRNFGEVNPAKAALSIEGFFPAPGRFSISFCDQCGACAAVCPQEAIQDLHGVYVIDSQLCNGCLACVDVCPSGVMFTYRDHFPPIKCTLCGECASICPREAIVAAGGV